jgi:HlyD family secretion protein
MEYGMVIGTVLRIAPVPVNNIYSVEIELPDKLITNYGNFLEMQQELQGTCEIITADLRLIQRIIYPIRAVFEKNRR